MSSKTFILTFLFFPSVLFGQLDTIHYMPPFFASEAPGEQFIFLSTPSQQDITVKVHTPQGNLIQNVIISNANPDFIYFGDDETTRLMVEVDQLGIPQNDEGLIFKSDQEFYCNYRVTSNDGNHSGSITCKGTIARGRVFRPGHMITSNAFGFKSNTVSIMALENAAIRFSNLANGLELANYGVTNGAESFQLNAGETITLSAVYSIFAPNDVRGFFGSLIESTGDLVVNVGSHTGGVLANNFRDIGVDQIVPMNSLGTQYILVRGNGLDEMENVIVCFHENNTELSINGDLEGTFNAGDFLQIEEGQYTANDNMYLEASEDIAVYQMIGGLPNWATYGMNFIPPLSCLGEPKVDNIPFYNSIDDFTYDGNIIIIARNGFPVEINGIPLPANLGRPVDGNMDYLTYKISNDLGVDHITVSSTGNVQVGLTGGSNFIGFAGYFSGFERSPKAIIADLDSIDGICLDTLRALGTYEKIDWYFQDSLVAVDMNQIPSLGPGEYYAVGYFAACPDIRDTTLIYHYPVNDTTYTNSSSCSSLDTGIFVRILSSVAACDSVVVERVGLLPQDTFSQVLTTCNPAEAGLDTLQLLNQFGCDSIVYRQIDLMRRDTLREEFFVCKASDIGTDTLVFTNQVGCDSIRILQFRYVGVDTSLLEGEICEGEQLEFEGLTVGQPGRYCVNLTSFYGCDSVRCLDLEVQPIYQNVEADTICQGAFAIFRGDTLTDSGFYEYDFTSVRGCDSTVILNLMVTTPPPFSQLGPDPYCEGEQTSLRFQCQDSFNLQWLDEPGAGLERDFIDPGVYPFVISYAPNCQLQDSVIVPEPIVLSIELDSISDFNGYNVSCPDNSDGFMSIISQGGIDPIHYEWSAGFSGISANNLQAGLYTITMTDGTGCRDSFSVELSAPPPINYQLGTRQINCLNDEGTISISALSGGISPFELSFGNQVSDTSSWSGLSPGLYSIQLKDANDCGFTAEAVIEDQTDSLFLRIIGQDTIPLGDQLQLTFVADDPMISWEWSSPEHEDCINCQIYEFQPTFSQSITLEGVNQQGCITRVTQSIALQLIYEVYIPNAFSPNGDANNDFHVVYGGPSVDRILNYQVFSRWGSKVFENSNLEPGVSDGFWDGSFNGLLLNSGVFVYVAEVQFIDGKVKVFSGDVTLFR